MTDSFETNAVGLYWSKELRVVDNATANLANYTILGFENRGGTCPSAL